MNPDLIGSPPLSTDELLQVHENIRFRKLENQGISEQIAQLYKNGLSISDISKQTGKAKSTINSLLHKEGVELRPNKVLPFKDMKRDSAKGATRPPYGFCYFQGKVTPDPREYENLLLIYNLWKDGINPNSIANHLSSKKIPARNASTWNRNSIVLIIKRFEESLIVHKGGQLELR